MPNKRHLTGKPSIDKPWMKYYPQMMLDMIEMPKTTILQYLREKCPGEDVSAIHYYGNELAWSEVFGMVDPLARSLKAMGFKEGDQIPVFFRLVPEFVPLLLAAEKIGASILCRDNSIEENAEAVEKAGASVIFAHDFISNEAVEAFEKAGVKTIVLLDPIASGNRDEMPDYILNCLMDQYSAPLLSFDCLMTWEDFLDKGEFYTDTVEAPEDITRPLYRCYTSGSTGPSKQVIHSAETMLDVICQMNFYGGMSDQRPNWMVTCLPPALVAVVVSMVLLPLSSNKLLIMNPFVYENDVDLEFMRYKANNWPILPCLLDVLLHSDRIPADYDMSHLVATGPGCESCNNRQMDSGDAFFKEHGCTFNLTTGYGCSEGGSNLTLPMTDKPIRNGNVGVPMPLSTLSIFKPGTQIELGYNQIGEICKTGPGTMLGYDCPEATAKALQLHDDGNVWLHIGDMGYMDEDGVIYTVGRGGAPRYSGGYADIQSMENRLADAHIPGIEDEFYVSVPDDEHPGYFLPYLYVVLEKGYTLEDIADEVMEVMTGASAPVEIIPIQKRPFWHFKTNRLGLVKEIQEMRSKNRRTAA